MTKIKGLEDTERCACGRTDCDLVNRNFHRMLKENPDLLGQTEQPSFRNWTHKNRWYCWSTEKADQNLYWAFVYRWKDGHGTIVKRVGFRLRWKAKQRTYDWYTKAAELPGYDWRKREEK